jgi:hypothetical protein
MVHAFHPSYSGSVNRKIVVKAGPGINTRPYWKITKTKRARVRLKW